MRSGLTQTPNKRASLRIRLIASVVSEKGAMLITTLLLAGVLLRSAELSTETRTFLHAPAWSSSADDSFPDFARVASARLGMTRDERVFEIL
jgi:hypothetical protein